MEEDQSTIHEVAAILRQARRVLFITGAGVSAESGLPTYRGVGGLYDDQETEDGVPIEVALSGPMFAGRPGLTWKYLWQIGAACANAAPNAAHEIMAAIESEKEEVWVITQNVDGLHRSAGTRNLVEVHGHMFDLYCITCRARSGARDLLEGFGNQPPLPPTCATCGGVIRPDVVLFEEALSMNVIHALNDLLDARFDVVFAVGTTAVFSYIRQPILLAHAADRPTVEINPADTAISSICQYRIRLGAAEALMKIRACG